MSHWTVKWDEQASCPYAYKGNQWLSYDDNKSIGLKLDFLIEKKLGGAMGMGPSLKSLISKINILSVMNCIVWSIDTDDFQGNCGNGKYPLMKAITKKLNNSTLF